MYVVPSGFTPALLAGQTRDQPVIGWQTLVTSGNVAADTEEAEYPASNLANGIMAAPWRAADTTDQDIVVALAGETIDYVAIAAHNLGTSGVPVTLSIDDGGGYATVIPEFTPADDGVIIMEFAPVAANAVKLRLNTGGSDPAEIAVLYIGALLRLQRRVYVGHTPLPYGRMTDVQNGRSENGNFLGRIVTGEERRSAIALQNLTPAWVRSQLEPFLAAAQAQPFFWAWRPHTYPAETGFAWLTADAVPQNARSNGMMSIDMQIAGIA